MINATTTQTWIPEWIPMGVSEKKDETMSPVTPVDVSPIGPDAAPTTVAQTEQPKAPTATVEVPAAVPAKEWWLDQLIKKGTIFLAKLLKLKHPITGEKPPVQTNPAEATTGPKNIIGNIRTSLNKGVEKAWEFAKKAEEATAKVADKAKEATVKVTDVAKQATEKVKDIIPQNTAPEQIVPEQPAQAQTQNLETLEK